MNLEKRFYDDYIHDMVEAIEKAISFVDGMTYDELSVDDKTVFAVIRALEIIGEATKKIPDQVRQQNPDVPWKEMAGMRDKLIHDYMGVNLQVVRLKIQEELPKLQKSLQSYKSQ